MKKKIIFAIGEQKVEDYIKGVIKDDFILSSVVIYREGILNAIRKYKPDVIVIREFISGSENIFNIMFKIREEFPETRIVFIAGDKEPGDEILAQLILRGILDIICGESILVDQIIEKIKKPSTHKDVEYLLPKFNVNNLTSASDKNYILKEKQILDKVEMETKNIEIIKEIPKSEDETVTEKEDLANSFIKNALNLKKLEITKEKSTKPKLNQKENLFVPEDEIEIEINPEVAKKEKLDAAEEIKKKRKKISNTSKENVEIVDKKSTNISEKVALISGVFNRTNKNEETEKPEISNDKNSQSSNIFSLFQRKGKKKKDQKEIIGRGKILTFVGGKGGTGNTVNALNMAVTLAESNKNVIYVEVNKNISSIGYWFELIFQEGFDNASKKMKQSLLEEIEDSIIFGEDLVEGVYDGPLSKNYKKYPRTLDYMAFSGRYLTRGINEEDELDEIINSEAKNLYLHLLFQMGYDFVILDVPPLVNDPLVIEAVKNSNYVFFSNTQNLSGLGNSLYMIEAWKKYFSFNEKGVIHLINRYQHFSLNDKKLQEFLNSKNVIYIPDVGIEIDKALYDGYLPLFKIKDANYKDAFEKMKEQINR